MSFDIHGNPLSPGHCEVHPWVHAEYPCPQCVHEREQNDNRRAGTDNSTLAARIEHLEKRVQITEDLLMKVNAILKEAVK